MDHLLLECKRRMPGCLAQRNEEFSYGVSEIGFWSKHRDDVSYNQLHKFWSELSLVARQKLLRIDKQTLFEQARRNMYCSRCNGLLLEGFLQIVMYGKTLRQEAGGRNLPCNGQGASDNQNDCGSNTYGNEIQDPSVHPWGGLATTRDGSLTLLDCYLHSKSLKGLQNVFDSARARERERELLYPDACGGGGRGWISQGIVSYGRGHGTRETCALHTARLSCETLVDFWSALGGETRQSLLRMKEEDFIERLMYRFDSKRFCRDCRRNVIREFKELKELKRMRREPRCTSWFCVADTAFQYEVSDDTIQADWGQTFAETVETYHHFEWAVGSGEGKADILEFENVGMNGRVQVSGLDLGGLSACFITLRAWKLDGRCTELSVKAHALKGQQCVHCRLVVGDGFVTINQGESITRFFEHAEEAEEEEDDDSIDKDGNEMDGECSRPQKHAKSPELAREFLLDAATVIFKEQVEKAFREGTARQNAHSIFVCLSLKMLEERVHVACKEIITLEKQMKLIEEEEKEKHEEEERRERRRTKEREKKHRRRERLKGKERDREKTCSKSNEVPVLCDVTIDETSLCVDAEPINTIHCQDSASETGNISLSRPGSPDIQDQRISNGHATSVVQNASYEGPDREIAKVKDGNGFFTIEQSKFSRHRLRFRKEVQLDPSLKWSDRRQIAIISETGVEVNRSESRHPSDNFETSSRGISGSNRQSRINGLKSRSSGLKFSEKYHCPNNRMHDRYDFHSCSCHQISEYRIKVEPHVSAAKGIRDTKPVVKSESASDVSKQFYRGNKYGPIDFMRENYGRPKSKCNIGNNTSGRDTVHPKKVWEPMESQKKYPRSNSDTDVTLRSSTCKVEGVEPNGILFKSCGDTGSGDVVREENNVSKSRNSSRGIDQSYHNESRLEVTDPCYSTEATCGEVKSCRMKSSVLNGTSDSSMVSTSSSDNCSSCLSEGDSNTTSSNNGNLESSSTSDSEDASQQSEGRETSLCNQTDFSNSQEGGIEKKMSTNGGEPFGSRKSFGFPPEGSRTNIPENLTTKTAQNHDDGITAVSMGSHCHGAFPPAHNRNLQFPMFQAAPSTVGYCHQNPVSWPAAPANRFMPFSHPNQYLYATPLGYGLNGNSTLCMQYGSVQHLASPAFNPVYHPVANVNCLNTEEQTRASVIREAVNGTTTESIAPARPCQTEAAASTEGGKTGKSAKLQTSNTGFSLFHFGGPVALTAGSKAGSAPLNDEMVGDLSSNLGDQVENGPDCNKKESTMEEYNLFAASNGLRFSFF